MHWALGLFLGVCVVLVLVFMAYCYFSPTNTSQTVLPEKTSLSRRINNNIYPWRTRNPTPPLQHVRPKELYHGNQSLQRIPPPVEEFNDIRTFDITELPFTTKDLNIKNCVSAEILRAVIPRGEYTVDESENDFTITGPNGSRILEIEVQDYSIVELCAAIEALVQGTGTDVFADATLFTCSYDYGKSITKFAHSTPEEFTIHFNVQLAYSLGFKDAENTSSSGILNGPNRVDLFGSRTVQIRTNQFEPAHYNGIMQDLHIANELTLWENNTDIRWAERRFRLPRNIGRIEFSIMTRHPSQTQEADYKQLALNGVVAHLTVCFRRKRYSTSHLAHQELELS
jgi:hypothetical protein